MKITVPVTFPSFPRITPVIQAVLFEDPADARFLSTWPVTQVIYCIDIWIAIVHQLHTLFS